MAEQAAPRRIDPIAAALAFAIREAVRLEAERAPLPDTGRERGQVGTWLSAIAAAPGTRRPGRLVEGRPSEHQRAAHP